MAEKSFASIGYFSDGKFKETMLRARDVFDSQGISTEDHQTNGGIHLTGEQTTLIAGAIQAALLGTANGVATLDASGRIPAAQLDLGKYATSANVATYAEMLALTATQAKVNTFVFVADATGDPTVDEGWAAYKRVATNGDVSDYVKVAEGESLDISFPDLEQGITEAKNAAASAASAAATADGKADTAKNAADAAQSTADAAVGEASKLDFAFCVDEEDMKTKNLREGAMVLILVDND